MKLKVLLKDLPQVEIKGLKDIEITGLCSNSRLVAPGNLFIAKKGFRTDGSAYIQEALDGGAVAILSDIYNPFLKNVVQIIHPQVKLIESIIAAKYYQNPSLDLFTIGVTGTAGKTTVAYFVKHILDGLKKPCGLIGTIEYIVQQSHYMATLTTPDVLTVQRLLRDMIQHECLAAVMEVSSHALDQERVKEVQFDIGIFTNLTEEHLDYHKDMEHYAAAKAKLFNSLNGQKKGFEARAIVNADSPWTSSIIANCKAPVMSYGLHLDAHMRAKDIHTDLAGSHFNVVFEKHSHSFSIPHLGPFNVLNCLAALCVGKIVGATFAQLQRLCTTLPAIDGRMQRIKNDLGIHIFVDFAHKPCALKEVLQTLQQIKGEGRIITVFGCGGNRDILKRPLMAQVAQAYSDLVVVTNDNPREEAPEAICRDILKGFTQPTSYIVELDRTLAISKAIDAARPHDVILIAGKGHEVYQIFGQTSVPFDDRQVAMNLCMQKKK